jgi:death-on-curing protein
MESAVAQASVTFAGEMLHPSLCDQAAAYLFHLAQNHPFLDGNKRAGAASALVFLNLDGLDFRQDVEDGPLYDLTIAVATCQADKATIAQRFSAWLL